MGKDSLVVVVHTHPNGKGHPNPPTYLLGNTFKQNYMILHQISCNAKEPPPSNTSVMHQASNQIGQKVA